MSPLFFPKLASRHLPARALDAHARPARVKSTTTRHGLISLVSTPCLLSGCVNAKVRAKVWPKLLAVDIWDPSQDTHVYAEKALRVTAPPAAAAPLTRAPPSPAPLERRDCWELLTRPLPSVHERRTGVRPGPPRHGHRQRRRRALRLDHPRRRPRLQSAGPPAAPDPPPLPSPAAAPHAPRFTRLPSASPLPRRSAPSSASSTASCAPTRAACTTSRGCTTSPPW